MTKTNCKRQIVNIARQAFKQIFGKAPFRKNVIPLEMSHDGYFIDYAMFEVADVEYQIKYDFRDLNNNYSVYDCTNDKDLGRIKYEFEM